MMINKINKTVIFGTLFFILILTSLYFGLTSNKLSARLKDRELSVDVSNKETLEIKKTYDKIQADYAKLTREHQALVAERDNALVRLKGLLAESELKKELETILANSRKEMQLLEKAKEDTLDQNLALREKSKDLQIIQKQLIREKEQLQNDLEQEREKSGMKKLQDENASFLATNKNLDALVKQKEIELAKIKSSESKLKEENILLNNKISGLNKSYAEALKKNKEFEEKVTRMPAKFSEIARQNQALIKRTANIHYNSGVFYSQHKEYARAVDEFEKAIELVPADAYSHFNAGYIYAEYLVNRPKAVEHFKQYLRFAKKDDKDVDWVRKYIISWESWDGKQPME